MEAKEFVRQQQEKAEKDYGLCYHPTSAQDALEVLIEHFLGHDWCSVTPMSADQVNTEAVYCILRENKKMFKWMRKIK